MNKPVWSGVASEAVELHGAGCYKGGVIWSAETSGVAFFFGQLPAGSFAPNCAAKAMPRSQARPLPTGIYIGKSSSWGICVRNWCGPEFIFLYLDSLYRKHTLLLALDLNLDSAPVPPPGSSTITPQFPGLLAAQFPAQGGAVAHIQDCDHEHGYARVRLRH